MKLYDILRCKCTNVKWRHAIFFFRLLIRRKFYAVNLGWNARFTLYWLSQSTDSLSNVYSALDSFTVKLLTSNSNNLFELKCTTKLLKWYSFIVDKFSTRKYALAIYTVNCVTNDMRFVPSDSLWHTVNSEWIGAATCAFQTQRCCRILTFQFSSFVCAIKRLCAMCINRYCE